MSIAPPIFSQSGCGRTSRLLCCTSPADERCSLHCMRCSCSAVINYLSLFSADCWLLGTRCSVLRTLVAGPWPFPFSHFLPSSSSSTSCFPSFTWCRHSPLPLFSLYSLFSPPKLPLSSSFQFLASNRILEASKLNPYRLPCSYSPIPKH